MDKAITGKAIEHVRDFADEELFDSLIQSYFSESGATCDYPKFKEDLQREVIRIRSLRSAVLAQFWKDQLAALKKSEGEDED